MDTNNQDGAAVEILQNDKKYAVTAHITQEDYIVFHKAEIESLQYDNNIVKIADYICPSLGACFLGAASGPVLTIDSWSDFSIPLVITIIAGLSFLSLGLWSKIYHNSRVKKILDKKIKESTG